jgi:hypothetical protein
VVRVGEVDDHPKQQNAHKGEKRRPQDHPDYRVYGRNKHFFSPRIFADRGFIIRNDQRESAAK